MGRIIGGLFILSLLGGFSYYWHIETIGVGGYQQEEAFEHFILMYYILGGLSLFGFYHLIRGAIGLKR